MTIALWIIDIYLAGVVAAQIIFIIECWFNKDECEIGELIEWPFWWSWITAVIFAWYLISTHFIVRPARWIWENIKNINVGYRG